MTFYVNHYPLYKETFVMISESYTSLQVQKYEFREQINTTSVQQIHRFLHGACKFPTIGLRITAPSIHFLTWSRPFIQPESSWLAHNICTTNAPVLFKIFENFFLQHPKQRPLTLFMKAIQREGSFLVNSNLISLIQHG